MIGWLIALAVLLLLLCMKAGVYLSWESQQAVLKVRIGFLRFRLWPDGKPEKVSSRETAYQPAPVLRQQGNTMLKKWLHAIWDNRKILLQFMEKTMRAPTLDRLRLHIAVGNPDPAVCALTYGSVCAAIGTGLSLLYQIFQVRKQDIDVTCRYDLLKTQFEGEAELTLRIYQLIALSFAGLKLLYQVYQSTKTTKKAVQNL